DRSQLINFVQKFLGTVKFGNDHVAKIKGYGDYQIGNGLVRGLSKLKFEKDHLCSACAMGKSTKKSHKPKSEDTNQEKLYLFHMDLCGPMHNGTEFVNQTLRDYYKEVGISHETSVARSPQQNGFVERRNRTLIEAARTMLIYAQALLFLWAEAVEPHVLHRIDPLYVFAMERLRMSLCTSSSGPTLQEMTPGTISSGLVQKPLSST
nr:integrase, catalytic region, zinc finger, CCHC-type, peptidase aspartic, catalytic [Tanacetum cinerariifolium]